MMQSKKVVLILSLLTITHFACAAPIYTGQWQGETHNNQGADKISMKIWLNETSGNISGRYCLIYQDGNRTDCSGDDDSNIRGKVDSGGKADITFDSWFGGKNGKATLIAKGSSLQWLLIKQPSGRESYIPDSFALHKISENYNDVKYVREFNTKTYSARIINRCDDFVSACENVMLMAINKKENGAFMLSGKAIIAPDNKMEFNFFDAKKNKKAEIKNNKLMLSINGKSVTEDGEWKNKY